MSSGLTLKLSHKGLVLVLIPLLVGLASFVCLYGALSEAEATARQQDRARIHALVSNELNRDQFLAIYCTYFFFKQYDAPEIFRKEAVRKFEAATAKLGQDFSEMQLSMAGTPEAEAWGRLQKKTMLPLQVLEDQEHSGNRSRLKMAIVMMAVLKIEPKIVKDLGIVTERYVAQEESAFQKQVEHRQQLKRSLLLAVACSIALAFVLYVYFNRDTSSRLAVLLDNHIRFARKQTLNPPLRGTDEIAQLDQAFRQMAQSITNAAKNKEEFMSMLGRDIRLPIDSINQSLRRLLEGSIAQTISQQFSVVVKRCLDSTAMLMRLVDGLLDIEKSESGKLQINFRQSSTRQIIQRATDALQGLAQTKNITFSVPSSEFAIYADPDKLVQVLINLLSNALKFSPVDKPVLVELSQQEQMLLIKVTDFGPGLSQENQKRVFERFHQISSGDKRSSGGSGLGLTIAKEIVEAHHGSIGVSGEEGKGCTFWVELPMTPDAMTARANLADREPANRQPAIVTSSKKSRRSLKLTQKGLILLGVPLIFGLTCFATLYAAIVGEEIVAQKEAVVKTINHHRMMLLQRGLEAAAVVSQIMEGNSEQWSAFITAAKQMHEELSTLHSLVGNDPRANDLLAEFQQTVMRPIDNLAQNSTPPNADDFTAMAAKPFDFSRLQPGLQPFQRHAESFATRASGALKAGVLAAICLNIIISFSLYVFFTRDTSNRLSMVLDNTLRFGRREPLHPPLEGDDEIAGLDEVFHVMTDAITRAADEKKAFMAMIAHDVRSPLSSVLTSLTLLSTESTTAAAPKQVQITLDNCIESSERLLQLINDLLDIEKLDAGKLQMQFEDVPMAFVLENAQRAVREFAEKKQVKLSIADTDAELHADPKRMVQLLVNLLSNAIENAAPGNTIAVDIDDKDAQLTVRVSSAIANHADSAASTLGLAMCRHIIDSHHGTMSTEAGGAVSFTVPKSASIIALTQTANQSALGVTNL